MSSPSASSSTSKSDLQVHRSHGALYVEGSTIATMAKAFLPYVPHSAKQQQQQRDGKDSFHITILSADEYKQIGSSQAEQLKSSLSSLQSKLMMHALGLARVSKAEQQAWYISIYSPTIQQFRQSLGLSEKDLHITLGFQHGDPHGTGNPETKLIDYMDRWSSTNELIEIVSTICSQTTPSSTSASVSIPITAAQELAVIRRVAYQLSDFTLNQPTEANNNTVKDIPSNEQEKIEILKLIGKYALKFSAMTTSSMALELLSITEDIAWNMMDAGCLFGIRLLLSIFIKSNKKNQQQDLSSFQTFLSHFPCSLNVNLLEKLKVNSMKVMKMMEENLRELNHLMITGLSYLWDDCQRPVIAFDKMTGMLQIVHLPRNFSWVKLPALLDERVESQSPSHVGEGESSVASSSSVNTHCLLAGSAFPSKIEHLQALHAVGIRHILTIHEGPLNAHLIEDCAKRGIRPYNFEVVDRTPPTFQQLKDMMKIMHHAMQGSHEGLLVHCQGGVGRTNTAIIAYLMCMKRDCSASDLIAEVTEQRKLILSQSQQGCLRSWYRIINEEEVLPIIERTPSNTIAKISLEQSTNKSGKSVPKERVPSNPVPVPTIQPVVSASVTTNYTKVASALNMPPLIMLCGVPASGKSTFSQAMVDAYPEFFIRINRDEMRGKGECDTLLQKGLQPYLRGMTKTQKTPTSAGAKSVGGHVKQCVILDGCHVSRKKRMEWLEAAHRVPAWCIYFERAVDECKERIQLRCHHPTIPAGTAGLPIIDSMLKQWETPSLSEGFLRVERISCDEDMSRLLSSLKIPFHPPSQQSMEHVQDDLVSDVVGVPAIVGDSSDENEVEAAAIPSNSDKQISYGFQDKPIKFPRTAHAINLGAATRDDKVLALSDLQHWIQQSANNPNIHVLIEEKVDGANIGFSIHPTDQIIIGQNRSHFITAQYHAQFAPLDKWIQQHSPELWNILIPGRHILYGEWLYATHSVSYNQLPSYFIAYDLFDVATSTFLPRHELAMLLSSTTIPHVSLIYEGALHSIEHVKSLVYGPSAYGDEPREGIVIRVCNDHQLVTRAKLVRPDFIAGNERWNRSAKLLTNKLKY